MGELADIFIINERKSGRNNNLEITHHVPLPHDFGALSKIAASTFSKKILCMTLASTVKGRKV